MKWKQTDLFKIIQMDRWGISTLSEVGVCVLVITGRVTHDLGVFKTPVCGGSVLVWVLSDSEEMVMIQKVVQLLLLKFREENFILFASQNIFRLSMWTYRVFDNELQKVWAYCSDQKGSLELKTGGKILLSLVHFDKYMSN